MASTAFQKALAKKKNAQKLMKTANEAEKGGDFTPPTITDGAYITQVHATVGVSPNKDIPFVEFKWKIVDDSEFNGKGWNKTHFLENEDPEREEIAWQRLGRDLKTLLDADDLQIASTDDVEPLVEQINAAAPLVKTAIKNWEKDGKSGFNTFFNGLYVDGEVEPESFSKGDKVIYDGNEYVVDSVNLRDKTAALLSKVTNQTTQGVSWSNLVK